MMLLLQLLFLEVFLRLCKQILDLSHALETYCMTEVGIDPTAGSAVRLQERDRSQPHLLFLHSNCSYNSSNLFSVSSRRRTMGSQN